MIKTYTSRPFEVDAVQWTGDNFDEITKFIGKPCDIFRRIDGRHELMFDDRDNPVFINFGDYILRRRDTGVLSWCSEVQFNRIYEE